MPFSKSTVAVGITEAFKDAAARLDVGQLVKEDHFTLFDAVQGLEIGHHTMDAGLLDEGESVDDGYDVSQSLLSEEIIWVMDQLLAYQMAWHKGFSLVQNVFSSVHIDNLLSMERDEGQPPKLVMLSTGAEPNELVQTVLRAFCISVIKSCDIVIDVIRSQEYYEEEDFNTQTCERNMLNDFQDNDYLQLLYEAYRWVERERRRQHLDEEHANAFQTRLAFNTRLLEAFIPIPEEVEALSGRQLSVDETLKVIKDTHQLAREVPDAFTVKLQRKLASTTPPRKLNAINFDDAMATAERISKDLAEACSCDLMGPSPDLQRIEAFLWSFAARNPLPFPRAAMQTMLLMFVKPAHERFEGIDTVLWRELQGLLPSQHCLSPEIFQLESPNDEGFMTCQAITTWLERLGPVALTYLKSLCQNKCRIRRRLTHVLRDTDEVFVGLRESFWGTAPPPIDSLSKFVKSRIILATSLLESRMMSAIVSLGLELGLYSREEMSRLSKYQMDIHSLMSGIRTLMIQYDTQDGWVRLARQTAASHRSLLADEDHLMARTTRWTLTEAYHLATQSMAALHTILHKSHEEMTSPVDPEAHLRQIRERFRIFYLLDMAQHAEATYSIDLRPVALSGHRFEELSTADLLRTVQEAPSRTKKLLGAFGLSKNQPKAFREILEQAHLGATSSSDEYWRQELRELYKAAIFMGLEMAKVRDLVGKTDGASRSNLGLQKLQSFGRQVTVPQFSISS